MDDKVNKTYYVKKLYVLRRKKQRMEDGLLMRAFSRRGLF